ncbi:MAG: L,D-transpeptidase family protein, partial [Lachnospiraceae bacterium]|nr:L,D-transpeptidase family protein [Lachnospiraceae bacterium]
EDRFIEGTYINGIYAGNRGAEEIEQEIRDRVEDYSIEVTFRGGAKETISGESIGYEYVSSGGVAKLLAEQDSKEWLSGRLGAEKSFTVSEATKYDQEKLAAVLNSLPEMQPANVLAPTNAFLSIENNMFTITPETQGNTLIYDELFKKVSEAAAASALTVNIETDENAYEKPVVYADNTDLIYQRDNLNSFLQTVITYHLKDGSTRTIDAGTLINWISQDENGWYYIDDGNVMANVDAYVTALAAEVDNVKTGVGFQSSASGVITLPTATYGLQIGKDQEVAQLFTEIMERTTTEREPVYSMDYTITLADLGIGGTYIEIDIPNQHLYYYKDGSLAIESDIVSGSEYTTPTPRGIYYIQNREQNVTLLGPYLADGVTRSYTTLVKYWLPFDIANGIGLHDASWRAEFGGDIYLGGGSHGCVNMPEAVAASLFQTVSVGTPVLVF